MVFAVKEILAMMDLTKPVLQKWPQWVRLYGEFVSVIKNLEYA